MNSHVIQMKANGVIAHLMPMLQAYVQVLRDNYPEYPKRIYKRNSGGHQFELTFETIMFELPGGGVIANLIRVTILHNNDEVFQIELPGAGFIIVEGIDENTVVDVELCKDGDWDGFLESQIPYLIREAYI